VSERIFKKCSSFSGRSNSLAKVRIASQRNPVHTFHRLFTPMVGNLEIEVKQCDGRSSN
jgi:hypothetical protein